MRGPTEPPDRESDDAPSRTSTVRRVTHHVVPRSVQGTADDISASADTDRAAKIHHDMETTLPSARDGVPDAAHAAHEPVAAAEPASLPRAPWTLVIARRSYTLARAAGKLVAEHPVLTVGIAVGAGVIIGRSLAPTGPKRLAVRLVTLFARGVGRSLEKAARAASLIEG